MEVTIDNFASKLNEFLKPLERPDSKKIKLILHVGTPKTGTTSLQTYLAKKQRKLRQNGILYPHNLEKLQHPTAPRHQWFEKNLMAANVNYFSENLKNIIAQVKQDTHTILISSEGIYNYWWDFSKESKKILKELNQLFDVEVWVWFREPLGFIESYYKQCIRNPQVKGNLCYGKDLSFAEMLDIAWFSQHLNYQGFVDDCESLFGKNNVLVFNYSLKQNTDVVAVIIERLGMATPHDNPTPRQNQSLNNASIAVLKTINRYNLKAKDKERLVPYLKEVNEVLNHYAEESLLDNKLRRKVLALFKPLTT